MDWPMLQAFIAVAEAASFSKGAERLHLTQPAISKRIAALEQDLGVPLFERIGRLTRLSAAGETLLPRAYQMQSILQDTRRDLGRLEQEISGRLSLATSHHIGLHRLPPILRNFTRQYPRVTLDIQFLDSEVAYQAVLRGHAELAVVTLAPEPRPPIEGTQLWRDPLDFVVAPEHPLSHLPDIRLEDVATHPAIFPGGNTFTHHVVRQLFDRNGLNPQISMSTNYLETIKMMVSIGLAWSILPRSMLDDQVVRLPLQVSLERQLGYIHHGQRLLSNPARALIGLLQAEARTCDTPTERQ